jgi:cytochrome oxidase Cu insertion factor (SCO1/SenC/PrrC family)
MRLRTMSRLVVGGVIAIFVAIAAFVATMPRASSAPAWENAGTVFPATMAAPNFALRDQSGRLVSLHGLRGRDVVLTFFYTHCPDTCPLTAQKLRTVLRRLGSEAARIDVLVVSTDPVNDTPVTARAFLRKNGSPAWHFLLGSYQELAPVWKAYHVYVPTMAAQRTTGPAHSAVMYLIDGGGREQVLLNDSVDAPSLAQDLHILLRDHHWLDRLPSAPVVGDRAPLLDLPALTPHRTIRLAQLAGTPVLINFWATWCIPCRSEMPLLERTHLRYGNRLTILGVDEQEPAGEVRTYVHQVHVTYPIALDGQGNAFYAYQVTGTPTTFFVDARGVIRGIQSGPLSEVLLRKRLATMLRA